MKNTKSSQILGVYCISNGFEHDSSVTYMKNGIIEEYYPLERISLVKYDNNLLNKQYLIFNEEKISSKKLTNSDIVFSDSFTDFNFKIGDRNFYADKANKEFPIERKRKIDANDTDKISTKVYSHELCHVFSNLPFYGTFPKKTLGVHIDGGASYSNRSAWLIDESEITYLESDWNLHDDVNNFSNNNLTQIILGIFGHKGADLVAPGRLMGLSGYGTYKEDLLDWLLKNNWFRDTTPKKFLKECKNTYNIEPNISNPTDPFLSNIANVIQTNLTSKILDYFSYLKQKHQVQSIAYAGGVALNILTNTKIWEQLNFSNIMIPPPCNDTGISIGACALHHFLKIGNKMDYIHSPFLCNSDLGLNMKNDNGIVKKVAELILDNKVIGVAMGKGEAGPRSLGHRSIIANPSNIEMKIKVSEQIKKRESYRPLAPIILDHVAKKVFEKIPDTGPNDFMLYEYKVNKNYRDAIPAVVHVDGTARAQIIDSEPRWTNKMELKFIRDLLTLLWEEHNIPCLINTSFNSSGMPIVNSREDSLNAATKIGLDYLILVDKLIKIRK